MNVTQTSSALTGARFHEFVTAFSRVIDEKACEEQILSAGRQLLAELIKHDDWLPPEAAAPDPRRYQQYLLHYDPERNFSVVSFVWGPGQATPIHDHTVWGLVGILRGAEISQLYMHTGAGLVKKSAPVRLAVGHVECLSPKIGDIHQVSNALPSETSVSIHVYGGDIGSIRRTVFSPDGSTKPFISGYSNAPASPESGSLT